MLSVQTALFEATKILREAQIASPELDARLLLEEVTGLSRLEIICEPDNVLSEEHYKQFIGLIKRRIEGEPVAHILGKKEFWSLLFYVTKDVLDPRPDSETIIESVLELFQDKEKSFHFLDLGTGSGCLSIAVLKEYPKSKATSVDCSEKALEIAKKNADFNQVLDRLTFVQTSWVEGITDSFDLIISNPPYIPLEHESSLSKEVLLFDPKSALFAGKDGLDAYRAIANDVRPRLKDQGYLLLEIGKGQGQSVKKIFEDSGFTFLFSKEDLQGIERVLVFV